MCRKQIDSDLIKIAKQCVQVARVRGVLIRKKADLSSFVRDDRGTAAKSTRAATKPPATKKGGKPRNPRANTPAAQITALASKVGMQDRDLQEHLVELIIERGYPVSDVPNIVDKSLEVWLNELMQNVPSAEVMDAAQTLAQQRRDGG